MGGLKKTVSKQKLRFDVEDMVSHGHNFCRSFASELVSVAIIGNGGGYKV